MVVSLRPPVSVAWCRAMRMTRRQGIPESINHGGISEPTPVFGEVWRDLKRQRKQSNDYLSKGSQSHGQHELVCCRTGDKGRPWPSHLGSSRSQGVLRYIEKSTLHFVGHEVLNNTVNCVHRPRRGSL